MSYIYKKKVCHTHTQQLLYIRPEKLTCKCGSGVRAVVQLDIEAVFEVDTSAADGVVTEAGAAAYSCGTGGGAVGRGLMGPFGLLVLADDQLSERTAVFFYLVKGVDGNLTTFFCQDELRCVWYTFSSICVHVFLCVHIFLQPNIHT